MSADTMRFIAIVAGIGAGTGMAAVVMGFYEMFQRFKLEDRVTKLEDHLWEKFGERP